MKKETRLAMARARATRKEAGRGWRCCSTARAQDGLGPRRECESDCSRIRVSMSGPCGRRARKEEDQGLAQVSYWVSVSVCEVELICVRGNVCSHDHRTERRASHLLLPFTPHRALTIYAASAASWSLAVVSSSSSSSSMMMMVMGEAARDETS